jgi:hypothetical protein
VTLYQKLTKTMPKITKKPLSCKQLAENPPAMGKTEAGVMTAFNVVRFRVKPGHEEHFIAAHRNRKPGLHGFRGGALIKTGERIASSASGQASKGWPTRGPKISQSLIRSATMLRTSAPGWA